MAEVPLPAVPASVVTQPVVISLLGSFHITVDGQPIDRFRSKKVRALLAYLLIKHAQPTLRTQLTELLWPNYHEQSARVNLRQSLASLRNSFAPYHLLYTDRQYVQFLVDPVTVWCDAFLVDPLLAACQQHQHRSLAQCAGCQERLQQIKSFYRGVFLENFPDIDSPSFSSWLETQRAYFADRLAEVQSYLPLRNKQRGNLPPPLTPLIGRTQELADLIPRLHHTVYRCVSLVGPGGIGKTRLACAVGEQLQADFPDGLWLVPLGALAPTTAAETPEQLHDRIATAIAMTMGCPLSGAVHPTDQVATHLADKTALLILDGFEHLAAGAAWLPTVLAAAPRLRLLVTSRHRLPLQSQLVYTVGGLGVPPEQPPLGTAVTHLIAQYASLQLFVERATSAQMLLAWDSSTLAAVNRLCRFVEGSPWAIEVAVSLLSQHTPATLLVDIQNNYRLLATDLIDLPARQRSAEAVFLTAWRLLSTPEAQTMARCAVFRGGFTLDAAQTVAAATPAILDALVQKSLLRTSVAERYTMHDLVRQFAEEQLDQESATSYQTRTAHAAYFMALLATWQPNDATIKWFRVAVSQGWDNVQAAWSWAAEAGLVALLQQGISGLAEFYNLTELFLEADALLGRTIDRIRLLLAALPADAQAADRHTLQTLLAHLLWRHCYFVNDALAETDRAVLLAQELLALANDLNDNALAARGYYELGVVAYLQGDFRRQQQFLRQALPLAQQYGTIDDQVVCLNLLGANSNDLGEPAVALLHYQQALALLQSGNYAHYELMVLNNIGSLLVGTGHFTTAIAHFQQALPRALALDFQGKIAFIIASLGEIALLVGDYATARLRLPEAHRRYIELHDHVLEAQILMMLGMLYEESGEPGAALTYCNQALASAGGHLYVVQQNARCTLGHLYRAQGQWAAAAAAYQQALTLSQGSAPPADVLLAQTYLAAVTLAQGDAPAALAAVDPLLTNFVALPFTTQQRPQALLLIAYEILVANHDPRAQAVLNQAWGYIQAQAAKIDDPHLRESFLTNVPVNRTLGQLYVALHENRHLLLE